MVRRAVGLLLVVVLVVAVTGQDGEQTSSLYSQVQDRWSHLLGNYHSKVTEDVNEYFKERSQEWNQFQQQESGRVTDFRKDQVSFYNWYLSTLKHQYHALLEKQHMYESNKVTAQKAMRDDMYKTYELQEQQALDALRPHFDQLRTHPFYAYEPYVHDVVHPYVWNEWRAHSEHRANILRAKAYDDAYTANVLKQVDARYKELHQEVDNIPFVVPVAGP